MKTKKIDIKNIHPTLSISPYLFIVILWNMFPYEWVRTLLVIWWLSVTVINIMIIIQFGNTEFVDIFKEK